MLPENALKNMEGNPKDPQATRDAISDSLENNTKDLTAPSMPSIPSLR